MSLGFHSVRSESVRFHSVVLSSNQNGLTAGEAVEQPLQRGDDRLFVEAVVHLTPLLANPDEASAAQQVEMMRDSRPAECDSLSDLADVQLAARQKLHQVLAHRVSERDQQVATDRQVLAERPNLCIQRTGIDQTTNVLLNHQRNTLKHINILCI